MGCKVQGVGCGVQGVGCGVQGAGSGVWGAGCKGARQAPRSQEYMYIYTHIFMCAREARAHGYAERGAKCVCVCVSSRWTAGASPRQQSAQGYLL